MREYLCCNGESLAGTELSLCWFSVSYNMVLEKSFEKFPIDIYLLPLLPSSMCSCAVTRSLSSPCSGRVIMLCFHSDVAEEINVNVPNKNVLVL